MKYKLNVLDRLIIPNLLPREGSVLEQTTAKEIRGLVKLKSTDFSKYGLEERFDPQVGGKTFTNESIDPEENEKVLEEIEVDLNKAQTQLLKEVATKLDDDKKVTTFQLDTIVKLKDMRG